MIVGIAHVAMEAPLERGIEAVESTGFALRFVDRLAIPAEFERTGGTGTHHLPLAVLGARDSIEIEVVDHAVQSGHPGAYCAVFRSSPPGGAMPTDDEHDEVDTALAAAGILHRPVMARLPGVAQAAWFDDAGVGDPGLTGLVCRVTDPESSSKFWRRFTKADAADHGQATVVTVASRIRGPSCRFLLAPRSTSATHAMNDEGFPSIGVLSSAVAADCDAAVAAGGRLRAEPIDTVVNGTPLTLALVEDPCGAPIELLGRAKRSGQ